MPSSSAYVSSENISRSQTSVVNEEKSKLNITPVTDFSIGATVPEIVNLVDEDPKP